MSKSAPEDDSQNRIVAVTLDEESIGRSGPDIEHERAIAIYDLIEKNLFAPEGAGAGPFTLHIGITGNRLMFDIRREDGTPVMAHLMSLTPFRRIVKDYFMICDSYYQAIRTATPDKIEAIDMGRRGLHDEPAVGARRERDGDAPLAAAAGTLGSLLRFDLGRQRLGSFYLVRFHQRFELGLIPARQVGIRQLVVSVGLDEIARDALSVGMKRAEV